jgi:hypothetical protein
MNKTRLTTLILCAILIIAALVALQTLKSWANPEVSVPAYIGRGDYQHFESQFFKSTTGRGEYQRYESQFFQPYTERGDYQRYESQFTQPDPGARKATFPM